MLLYCRVQCSRIRSSDAKIRPEVEQYSWSMNGGDGRLSCQLFYQIATTRLPSCCRGNNAQCCQPRGTFSTCVAIMMNRPWLRSPTLSLRSLLPFITSSHQAEVCFITCANHVNVVQSADFPLFPSSGFKVPLSGELHLYLGMHHGYRST